MNKEVKTKMQNKLVEHIGEEFIYYLSRDHHVFQNRSIRFFDMGTELGEVSAVIKIPHDLILCDCCNAQIMADKIPLHIRIDGHSKGMLILKAVCCNCVTLYYQEFIKIGNT
jgi:hypothetical protein